MWADVGLFGIDWGKDLFMFGQICRLYSPCPGMPLASGACSCCRDARTVTDNSRGHARAGAARGWEGTA